MSDSTKGNNRPKTLILGGASALAAVALAILAGWLIMKRVGEPQVATIETPPAAPATQASPQQNTQAAAQPESLPQPADSAAQSPAAPADAAAPQAEQEQQVAALPAPAAPEAQSAAPAAVAAQPEASDETTFELARIEPSGDAVFAGTTDPGARVELYAGERKIGESSSDAQGNWAVVLDKQLPAGTSDVFAVVTDKGGNTTRSVESIAVVIDPGKKAQPLIVAQSDTGTRVIQNPGSTETPATTAPAAQTAEAPAAPATDVAAETAGAAPAAAEETKVAALPQQSAPQPAASSEAAQPTTAAPAGAPAAPAATPSTPAAASASVSIEAADYGAGDRLTVSGRAVPGSTVRLYYDNEHVGDAVAGADGHWMLNVDRPLDGGVHAVRADALDEGGAQVAGRAEVSFIAALPKAEEQKLAAAQPSSASQGATSTGAAPVSDAAQAPTTGQNLPTTSTGQQVAATTTPSSDPTQFNSNRITIARGDNLWRLARDLYGRGIRYTTIYDANKDQIRNPDLIFPGQVFLLPRVNEAEQGSVN